jgi:hypothetical protein
VKKCNYCGRENRDGAAFCDGCGTLIEDRQERLPRLLTAKEKKRGWVAVAVAVFCAIAAFSLAWSTSEKLRTIGGYLSTIGGTWAVLTLAELRKPKPGTENDPKKQG